MQAMEAKQPPEKTSSKQMGETNVMDVIDRFHTRLTTPSSSYYSYRWTRRTWWQIAQTSRRASQAGYPTNGDSYTIIQFLGSSNLLFRQYSMRATREHSLILDTTQIRWETNQTHCVRFSSSSSDLFMLIWFSHLDLAALDHPSNPPKRRSLPTNWIIRVDRSAEKMWKLVSKILRFCLRSSLRIPIKRVSSPMSLAGNSLRGSVPSQGVNDVNRERSANSSNGVNGTSRKETRRTPCKTCAFAMKRPLIVRCYFPLYFI